MIKVVVLDGLAGVQSATTYEIQQWCGDCILELMRKLGYDLDGRVDWCDEENPSTLGDSLDIMPNAKIASMAADPIDGGTVMIIALPT